MNNQSKAD